MSVLNMCQLHKRVRLGETENKITRRKKWQQTERKIERQIVENLWWDRCSWEGWARSKCEQKTLDQMRYADWAA